MAETYSFEIQAEIKAARAAVEKFSDDTQKRLDKISLATAVSGFVDGFKAVKEASSKVIDFLKDCSAEAAKSEENIRLLNNAMRVTGEFSATASSRMLEFADNLAKVSTYSDDAILSSLTLAKNFGLTNLEARKLAQAAADLAAFTGQDLNSATQQLAATYNGFISRELAKMVPAVKNLTKAQLEAGAAVDLLAKKVDGSAKDALNSFSGTLKQKEKDAEDFKKVIGRVVNAITLEFLALGKAFVGNPKEEGQKQAEFFGFAPESGKTELELIKENYRKFRDLRNEDAREQQATREAVARRRKEDQELQAKEELERFKASFGEKRKEIILNSYTDQEKIDREFYASSSLLARGFFTGRYKSTEDYLKDIEQLRKKYAKDSLDLTIKTEAERAAAEKKFDEARKQLFEDSVKDPIRQVIKFGASLDTQQALAVGAGFASAITKGAKGAQDLIAKGIGDTLSYALTGTDALSGPISEIVTLLGQGPEKTKETVKQFAQAIPEMIKSLAESLPVLIETLVRELPPALAKAMPTVAVGFSTALVKNMPQIVKGFAEGLVEAAKQFVQEVINQIKSIGGLVGSNGVFGGGNGNGGILSESGIPILSDIGGFLGLADGGTVPDQPGLRGDKFGPVKLDAGETVIDRNLTQRLSAALDAGALGRGAPTTVILQVGQQELARVLLDLNRGGFRTA